MNQHKYEIYVRHMRKLADVENAIGVLSWDKEVNLPTNGARFRAQQVATLSGIAHEIFTEPGFGDLLQSLNENGKELTERQSTNIKKTWKDFQRLKKLDKDFVVKKSELISKSYHAWLKSRAVNSFAGFKAPLSDLIHLKREEAERLGFENHPYDALMEEFEPGCRCAELDVLFRDVREELVQFVQEIREKPQVEDGFLRQHFPQQKQWDFGIEMLKRIAYDFESGRQDISPHPFTINFSPQDVRVTTRIDENNFGSMTWSCIHEGGHALYEQGLSTEEYGLPLGRYLSLGFHESQSRLWENNVGRSMAFWRANYPLAQEYFPAQLKSTSLKQFHQGINKINPSLIRVESDELHYHFHILIRYELEKALIEGSIDPNDLIEAWNSKYKEYLGLDVPDDNSGILQDIHWAHGSFGYFPTYSLGSFYAAQFFHQATVDIPNLVTTIENGDTSLLLNWLREKIHQHGRFYTADALCTKITGEPLNFKYFMNYAREKFGSIYS